MNILYVSLVIGILSLAYAGFNTYRVMQEDAGTPKMKEIAAAIQEGAMAYMHRQFKVIAVFAIVLFALLAWAIEVNIAFSFLFGALLSAIAGYTGMNVSIRANVRTAAAAKKGLSQALDVAFRGGSVNGLAVVGLALIGVSSLYLVFHFLGIDEM